MNFNIDFLCAASAVLIVVFVQLILERKDSRFNVGNLMLLAFMIAAVLVMDFAVSSDVFLPFGQPTSDIALAVLLLLQCVTLAAFCWHVVGIAGGAPLKHLAIVVLAALPLVVDAVFLILGVASRATVLDDFSSAPIVGNPLFVVPLLCMAFYAIASIVIVLVRRRIMRRTYVACALLFAILVLLCLGAELVHPGVRVLSFGLSLGLGILVSAEVNPYEYLDTLTHAYDITAFRRRLDKLHDTHRRYSIALISLDRLPELRLIVGSSAADELLRQCANACRRAARTRKVYRVRDTVFAVFAFSHHEEERIRKEMDEFFEIERIVAGTSVTPHGQIAVIGQATILESPQQANQYLDFLMDKMRRGEVIAEDNIVTHDSFIKHRELRLYLEKAIAEDLFEVYFQPSWSIEDERFCSLEALSRLSHPEHGQIPPSDFIAMAESEGFVSKLDRLQFAKVCKFAAEHGNELRKYGIKAIKVNLSPADLLSADLGDWLLQTMVKHDVDPSFIQFEVTETSATQYDDELARLIEIMTGFGSSLCMDDFGSGYANLKMVLSLPFSVIKLDRSLLKGIEHGGDAATLYSSIVAMLHGLGFYIVAEGVENVKQIETLRSYNVNEIQGFYFAKPMPQNELLAMLAGGVARG